MKDARVAPALLATLLASVSTFAATARAAGNPDAGLERFRGIYKELIETNTTLSAGDCTLAAQRMAARLKAAGYAEGNVRVFVPDGHPREGGMVAELAGSDPAAAAILMLAHIDVVEANREDWTRDPFTLIEEDGYFYGRGTVDMKAQAAVWVDNLIRFREEGYRPRRTIKLALTCGEESNTTAVDGAGWLAEHDRPSVTAALAITEGTDGSLDATGHRVSLNVLAAEKTYADYTFEVTHPGGHSSRPVADNAIYHLVRAVDRVRLVMAAPFVCARAHALLVAGARGDQEASCRQLNRSQGNTSLARSSFDDQALEERDGRHSSSGARVREGQIPPHSLYAARPRQPLFASVPRGDHSSGVLSSVGPD